MLEPIPFPSDPPWWVSPGRLWIVERDNVLNHYLPVLHDETDSRSLVRELRAANLYPSIDAPEFTQHGGFIPADFGLHVLSDELDEYSASVEVAARSFPDNFGMWVTNPRYMRTAVDI